MSWILDSLATTKRFSGPKVEPEKEGELMDVAGRMPASEQTAPEQSEKPAGTVETAGGTVKKPAGTEVATPTASEWEKLIKENGYVGAFEKLYPKTNYEEDIKRQEKRRQMDLIAQMAQVGMQTAAAGMGARRFTPVTSNRQAIDERIEKLREAQKLADQRYGASMLQTAMQEYREKQQREQQKAAQERADAWKTLNFNYQVQKDKEAMEMKRQAAAAAQANKDRTYELNRLRLQVATQRAIQANGANKIATSAFGSDGEFYTRSTNLSNFEAKQIAQAVLNGEDLLQFSRYESDYNGNPKPGTEKIDWQAAAAYAVASGMLSGRELESRGFKKHHASEGTAKKTSPTGNVKESPTK